MNDNNPSRSSDPRRGGGCARFFLLLVVFGSLLLNVALCGFIGMTHNAEEERLVESRQWGTESAKDKIAVVRIEGVLMEGMTDYFLKQIEQAAKDDHVKAVVVRVDSPGGTVTAAEEIHRALLQLRDGKTLKYPDSKAKKIVVSMGGIAASGGYYIAMPAEKVFAESTTITGSIGVYASLPNVAGFIDQHGIKFELIKHGGIKAGGSPFHEMTPQERQPWQDMVDSSYDHFLDIVAAGRPNLKPEKLSKEPVGQRLIDVYNDKGNVVKDWLGQPVQVDYVRYRADGGSFTAKEALKYGLVDEIGGLEEAVKAAAESVHVSNYEVVGYDKPPTLMSLLGVQGRASAASALDPQRMSTALSPRMWYLAPQADLAGIMAAMSKD
jgi:protease-4